MIRAALYCRRSTDEHQMASLDVQIEEATRFIESQGWTLDPAHVFVDDAKSRAEFKKRPGLIAMINAAESRPRPFDVIVTRDESRLGGDTNRTCLVIQDIVDNDVELWYYYTRERVQLDTPIAKVMVTLRNFASELEREKISQRTHEHLLTKARKGYVTGGRVYGYDNVPVMNGDVRTRVEHHINAEQADVVRRIFSLYAAGSGLRGIAKRLNGEGVACPRVGKRGTGSWSPSSLHAMLRNERYRGVIKWNRREKAYRKGTKVRLPREAADWIEVRVPELAIINDALWSAAQQRMRVGSEYLGPKNVDPKRRGGRRFAHLLSGLARCADCGGPLTIVNHKTARTLIRSYTCKNHHDRGDAVCKSTWRVRKDTLEAAVTRWIAENVLTEEIVADVIAELRKKMRQHAKTGPDVGALEAEATRLRGELERLVGVLASVGGEKPAAVLDGIAQRTERLNAVTATIAASKAAPRALESELARLDTEARARLACLHESLASDPAKGRDVITALFEGPLRVHHEEGVGAVDTGTAVLGPIFVSASSNVASPTGFEPVLAA